MPNWTSNRIEAPAEVLKKYISKDENGKEYFDFNLVIPRPEIYDDPDLVSGGHEIIAIEWYKSNRGTVVPKIDLSANKKQSFGQKIESAIWSAFTPRKINFDEIEKYGDPDTLYEIGKKYVEAHDKYGYYDWYDWSYANWGTKWNACDCVINLNEGWVEFETAWCMPEPIILKIMHDNPNCEIRIIWHDEEYNGTHTYEHDGHGGYARYTEYEEQYEEEDEEE